MRFLLAAVMSAVCFLVAAGDASAGPLRSRLKARRAAVVYSSGCAVSASPAAFTSCAASHAPPAAPVLLSTGGCSGASCSAFGRGGFLGRLRR
jgi:hypothetical protein